jgi:hypothetical protein
MTTSQANFMERITITLLTTATIALSSIISSSLPASAQQLERTPQLLNATTTQPASFIAGGTYEFTIVVPKATKALEAISISQAKNNVGFDPDQIRVSVNGIYVPISAIGGENSDIVTIALERPIQPGSTVKVSLIATKASERDGVLLFGVTTYEVDNSVNGQFLGYGRITLFRANG